MLIAYKFNFVFTMDASPWPVTKDDPRMKHVLSIEETSMSADDDAAKSERR
jgi:hypothetical protein